MNKHCTHRGAGRFWRLGPVSRCSSARYPLSDVWLKSLLRRRNLAMTRSSSSKYSVLLLMSGTNLHRRILLLKVARTPLKSWHGSKFKAGR